MNIGKFPEENLGTRDAFHAPAIVSSCSEQLEPGQKVILIELGDYCKPVIGYNKEYHGIVDPFLDQSVKPYQAVVIMLKPGITTNVSHKFDIVADGVVNYSEIDERDDDGCIMCY